MEEKNPMHPLPPCAKTNSSASKIPSTIAVSSSQQLNGYPPNRRVGDKQMIDSKHTGSVGMDNDTPETLANDQARSKLQESDFDSSLSESSDTSRKDVEEVGNASPDLVEQSCEIEGAEHTMMDRLRVENRHLIFENEQLRQIIGVIRNLEDQKQQEE